MTVCTSCDLPGRIHLGDIGTLIEVDTCSDISSATAVSLIVEKPDGTVEEWIGYVYDTTKIRYVTQEGDLDMTGRYYLQAKVVLPSGEVFGDMANFSVSSVIEVVTP